VLKLTIKIIEVLVKIETFKFEEFEYHILLRIIYEYFKESKNIEDESLDYAYDLVRLMC